MPKISSSGIPGLVMLNDNRYYCARADVRESSLGIVRLFGSSASLTFLIRQTTIALTIQPRAYVQVPSLEQCQWIVIRFATLP
jgi:hypothetical protein